MTDSRDLTELIFNPEKGGCLYNNHYKLLTGQFYVDNWSGLTKHNLLNTIGKLYNLLNTIGKLYVL